MTGSARIDDQDGNNLSVISVDFVIKNLINNLFKVQDEDEYNQDFDSHSVLFHVENNTVYHHKNWDSNERTLKSWQDLEFNSTISPYKEEEKQKFLELIELSKEYSLKRQFDIDYRVNITQFYQFWKKNDKPQQYFIFYFKNYNLFTGKLYFPPDQQQKQFMKEMLIFNSHTISLIYPIEVEGPHNVWNKTKSTKQVLMIGKVRSDITGIFRVLNLSHDRSYSVILSIQTGVVILIIFIITLHYGAVLKYQVDIPLEQLTQFLIQNSDSFKQKIKKDDQIKRALINKLSKKFQHSLSLSINVNKNNIENNKFQERSPPNRSFEGLMQQTIKTSPDKTHGDSFSENKKVIALQKSISFSKKIQNKRSTFGAQKEIDQQSLSLYREKSEIDQFLSSHNHTIKPENLILNVTNNSNSNQANVLRPKNESNQEKDQLDKSLKDKDTQATSQLINLNSGRSISLSQSLVQKVDIDVDLEPMFLEMQIIKETFHQLQTVITYKKTDAKYNKQINEADEEIDESQCILHYAFTSKMFKQLKNNFGLALSSINLGYFCQRKSEYVEALSHYESAMYHSFSDLGFNNLFTFVGAFNNGQIKFINNDQVSEQISIICISLVLQAHAIKEVIMDRRDLYRNKKIIKNFMKNQQMRRRWINLAIFFIELVKSFAYQLSKSKHIVFVKEILLLIDSEYIEMVNEKERVQHTEKLLVNLENDYFSIKAFFNNDNFLNQSVLLFKNQNNGQQQASKYPSNIQEEADSQGNAQDNQDILVCLIEGKIQYLKGMIEQRKKNYRDACAHYLLCLEQHYYLDLSLQKKIIENIGIIFVENGIKINNLFKEYNLMQKKQIKKVYDIAIVVEASVGVTATFQNIIQVYLEKMFNKFIRKSDRTTFITFYDKYTSIVQPLLPIEKLKQWKFCIEAIPAFSMNLIQEEYNLCKTEDSFNLNQSIFMKNQSVIQSQKKQFVKLQKQFAYNNLNNSKIRQNLFIMFTNSNTQDSNFKKNFSKLIKGLQEQFPSQSQIIHVQLQNHQSENELYQATLEIQNDSSYIVLSSIQQLKYFINFHKRSDNSQNFLTNLILTKSNL